METDPDDDTGAETTEQEVTEEMFERETQFRREFRRRLWDMGWYFLAASLTSFSIGLALGNRINFFLADWLALFVFCLLAVPLAGFIFLRAYRRKHREE